MLECIYYLLKGNTFTSYNNLYTAWFTVYNKNQSRVPIAYHSFPHSIVLFLYLSIDIQGSATQPSQTLPYESKLSFCLVQECSEACWARAGT